MCDNKDRNVEVLLFWDLGIYVRMYVCMYGYVCMYMYVCI